MHVSPFSDTFAPLIRQVSDFPKPGVTFNDITPLLCDGAAFGHAIDWLATECRTWSVDVVVGIDALGFIVGASVAHALRCGFVPARKPGKLPRTTEAEGYRQPETRRGGDAHTEPRLEMHGDAFPSGVRVLIVDDVLGGGGTSLAVSRLVTRLSGQVIGFAFLLELVHLGGRQRLAPHEARTVVSYTLEA